MEARRRFLVVGSFSYYMYQSTRWKDINCASAVLGGTRVPFPAANSGTGGSSVVKLRAAASGCCNQFACGRRALACMASK